MKIFILGAAALLAGCAGLPPAPSYPSHETAVVKTYVHNLGFKGLFASEMVRSVSTRADMRRAEDQFQFSGYVMKHLTKARDGARIWRVDKNLLWSLNLEAKTYTECPLTGCVAARREAAAAARKSSAPSPRASGPSCALTLVKNRFMVRSTGQTRQINGFSTKGYTLTWDIVAQDARKNKSTSSFRVDLWTTPENDPRLAAVRAVEGRFAAAISARRAQDSSEKTAIPTEALKIFETKFLSGFTAARRPSLAKASSELGKIHGYPISTTVNWYLDGNACQAAPQAQSAAPAPDPGLNLGSVVGGLLGTGAHAAVADAAPKPVFGFVEEVREMKVEPASDGLFVPTPGFKLKPAP